MQIHVIQNGNQIGPYSPAQFDDLLQQGTLGGGDLYWYDGCEGWLPVLQHPDFRPSLAVVVPRPSSPPRPAQVRGVVQPAGSLNICPSCGHAVAPSATSCPNCGGRLRMGILSKLAIGCGALVALYLVLFFLVPILQKDTQAQRERPRVPPPARLAASPAMVTPPTLVAATAAQSNPDTLTLSNEELLAQARQILKGDHPAEALMPLRRVMSDDPNIIAAVALEEDKITPEGGRTQWQRLYDMGEKAGPIYELAKVHLDRTERTAPQVSKSSPVASPSPASPAAPSPRTIVSDFYTWYLAAVRRGRSPWLGGELSGRSEVSHGFAVRLENAKEPEPGDDPIFAAHSVPDSFVVETDRVNGFDATVAVRLAFGSDRRLVNVRLTRADEGEPWRIDDVQPVLADNPAPSPPGGPAQDGDLTQRAQLAEGRLNTAYGQLRARLDARRKAMLKTEEVEWIKRKDALAMDDPRRIDMIDHRITEFAHWGEPTANGINQGFVAAPSAAGPTPTPTTTTTDTSLWATGSWPLAIYRGSKLAWPLVLPSYWRLTKHPLDSNADAAWEGPKGLVLSAYSVDEADLDNFWSTLKKSGRITQVNGPQPLGRAPPKGSMNYFGITTQVVGSLQLRYVAVADGLKNRSGRLLAVGISAPSDFPQTALEAALSDIIDGMIYSRRAAQNPNELNLNQRATIQNDKLLKVLAYGGHPPDNTPASTPILPKLLTKAQWKDRMARNFRYYPGTPVIGSAQQFQQIMGKPDRTQTVGDQAYWYYQCADGTIQLVMNVLNLQMAGLIQADVNDY